MFNKLLSGLRKVFTTPTPLNTVPVPQRPAYIPSYERRSEESDEDGLVFGKRLDALELNTDRIPVVMDDFLSFAQLKSVLETQGIYRLSGSQAFIKDLKKRLNTQGRIALDNEPMDALHGVLGCFKLFIKEIKGGLIPYGFVEAFVAAKGNPEQLLKVMSALPELNQRTLKTLLRHLLLVNSKKAHNSMSLMNLAKVFSANIFSTSNTTTLGPILSNESYKQYVLDHHISKDILAAAGALGQNNEMILSSLLTVLSFEILEAVSKFPEYLEIKSLVDDSMKKCDSAVESLRHTTTASPTPTASTMETTEQPSTSNVILLRNQKLELIRFDRRTHARLMYAVHPRAVYAAIVLSPQKPICVFVIPLDLVKLSVELLMEKAKLGFNVTIPVQQPVLKSQPRRLIKSTVSTSTVDEPIVTKPQSQPKKLIKSSSSTSTVQQLISKFESKMLENTPSKTSIPRRRCISKPQQKAIDSTPATSVSVQRSASAPQPELIKQASTSDIIELPVLETQPEVIVNVAATAITRVEEPALKPEPQLIEPVIALEKEEQQAQQVQQGHVQMQVQEVQQQMQVQQVEKQEQPKRETVVQSQRQPAATRSSTATSSDAAQLPPLLQQIGGYNRVRIQDRKVKFYGAENKRVSFNLENDLVQQLADSVASSCNSIQKEQSIQQQPQPASNQTIVYLSVKQQTAEKEKPSPSLLDKLGSRVEETRAKRAYDNLLHQAIKAAELAYCPKPQTAPFELKVVVSRTFYAPVNSAIPPKQQFDSNNTKPKSKLARLTQKLF